MDILKTRKIKLLRLSMPIMSIAAMFFLITLFFADTAEARKLRYKEEFYNLYYLPQKYTTEDLARNLYWLQYARKAEFAPPIQALFVQEKADAYQKYKRLLNMHIGYLLSKNWVFSAARFDKHRPVFFNLDYSKDILESLKIAEGLYEIALAEWEYTVSQYEAAQSFGTRTQGLEFLEQELYKIYTREIDYERVINRQLKKLRASRAYFESEGRLPAPVLDETSPAAYIR